MTSGRLEICRNGSRTEGQGKGSGMADQGRWFKLWHSALSDDGIQALSPAMRWAWAAFGCHTKVYGTHGRVTVSTQNAALAAAMGVTMPELKSVISSFPNCTVSSNDADPVTFTVTWRNWHKYQVDFSGERVARFRAKHRDGVTPKKRREENIRKVPKESLAQGPGSNGPDPDLELPIRSGPGGRFRGNVRIAWPGLPDGAPCMHRCLPDDPSHICIPDERRGHA